MGKGGGGWEDDGVSFAVWRVLYRAEYFVADSGDAAGEAGGGGLRAVDGGFSVRAVWAAGAAGGVREFAAAREYVRERSRGGVANAARVGDCDDAVKRHPAGERGMSTDEHGDGVRLGGSGFAFAGGMDEGWLR